MIICGGALQAKTFGVDSVFQVSSSQSIATTRVPWGMLWATQCHAQMGSFGSENLASGARLTTSQLCDFPHGPLVASAS